MKATTINKTSFTNYPFGKSPFVQEGRQEQNPLSFQHFTVPTPMTEQEIAPPLHVWERIVSVLDEQDRTKSLLSKPQSFLKSENAKSSHTLLYTVMAGTAVAGLMWLLS